MSRFSILGLVIDSKNLIFARKTSWSLLCTDNAASQLCPFLDGLQLPETAAAWSKLAAVPASSSRRSSNSGLGSTRTRPAWSRSERNGTVQHGHFIHDASAMELVVHARCHATCVRQPHETTEHPAHAHSGHWLDRKCTLCAAIAGASAM